MTAGAEGLAWDYVIVGSGAGGGTLAARLAESGMRVFLLEAGGDPRASDAARMPDDYDVPALPRFRVREPGHELGLRGAPLRRARRGRRATRSTSPGQGVLYPRAAALGGCTAHNAMIYMPPHDSDWDRIAALTDDCVVERFAHAPLRAPRRGLSPPRRCGGRCAASASIRPGTAGTGWLSTEKSIPLDALGDDELVQFMRGTTRTFVGGLPSPLASSLAVAARRRRSECAAVESRQLRGTLLHAACRREATAAPAAASGCSTSPLRAASACTSSSMRSRLASCSTMPASRAASPIARASASTAPTRTRAREPGERARGARAARGHPLRRRLQHAAAADAVGNRPGSASARARHRRARRPAGRRRQPAGPLRGRADASDASPLANPRGRAASTSGDALWRRWNASRGGMYASNGAALALIGRSAPDRPEPDLFCMALLARFEGYRPGFSKLIVGHRRLPDLGHSRRRTPRTAAARCACARPIRATRRS